MIKKIRILSARGRLEEIAAYATSVLYDELAARSIDGLILERLDAELNLATTGWDPLDLIVLWCQPEQSLCYDMLLSLLGGQKEPPKVVLVGPALADPNDADYWIRRFPVVFMALWGEPEGQLIELIRRLRHGEDLHSPPICPDRYVFDRTWLPHQSEAAKRPRRYAPDVGGDFLEVARGVLPFSPLPLQQQPGLPHSLPKAIVIAQAEHYLQRSPKRLHILPEALQPLDEVVQALLEKFSSTQHKIPLSAAFSAVPDSETLGRFRQAGLRDLTLSPSIDALETDDAEVQFVTSLKRLEAHPFKVFLRLPLLHTSADYVTRCLNYLRFSCVVRVELEILRLWPGHPKRKALFENARNHPESTRLLTSVPLAPPYLLLPHSTERTDSRLLAIAQSPPRLIERYPNTLRFIARQLMLPLSGLLIKLFPKLPIKGPRASLNSEVSYILSKWDGAPELKPAITALMIFEEALRRGRSRQPSPPPGETTDLESTVLKRTRGFEVRIFPFDVLAMQEGRVDAPSLGRFPVLFCWARGPIVTTKSVTREAAALYEAVDAQRTGEEVLEAARRALPPGQRDSDSLKLTLTTLYQEGVIGPISKNVPIPELDPTAIRRVLPFRQPEKSSEEANE